MLHRRSPSVNMQWHSSIMDVYDQNELLKMCNKQCVVHVLRYTRRSCHYALVPNRQAN